MAALIPVQHENVHMPIAVASFAQQISDVNRPDNLFHHVLPRSNIYHELMKPAMTQLAGFLPRGSLFAD
jgi:hypothetical protein